MVDALTKDRADEPFDMGVLPGRAQQGPSIDDAERPQAAGDDHAISAVPIVDEAPRRLVPAAGLGELTRNLFGGLVHGHARP